MPQSNRNIVMDFISILSLMISCFSLTIIFMNDLSFGMALLFTLTSPFLLISVGKTIHLIYRIVRKKELQLWEKILVPLFLLICLANFSPLTPANYHVSQYNPHTRMLVYIPDIDGWRGGESYVFRDDSTAEYRLSHRGYNGELKETLPYSRTKETIIMGEDTFFLRNDTIFKRLLLPVELEDTTYCRIYDKIIGMVEYDKDKEEQNKDKENH